MVILIMSLLMIMRVISYHMVHSMQLSPPPHVIGILIPIIIISTTIARINGIQSALMLHSLFTKSKRKQETKT